MAYSDNTIADLPDLFARVALIVLRGSGLRIGELLDLELDCVVDYGPTGHWLRVPLGKLNSERSIPLDPHRRDGRMVDFLFQEHGRRLGTPRSSAGWPMRCAPRQ